jgi:hypothetical protein
MRLGGGGGNRDYSKPRPAFSDGLAELPRCKRNIFSSMACGEKYLFDVLLSEKWQRKVKRCTNFHGVSLS